MKHRLTDLVCSGLILATVIVPAIAEPAWESGPGYRSRPLALPRAGQTGFQRLAAEAAGISFTNLLSQQRQITNQIYLNGSGVAAGDVDGDGLCDLYFCGLDTPNQLYHNLGDWKFEDITATAGVACAGLAATGAALADLDGDGSLDLVVDSVAGGTHIFLNDGQAHFRELDEAGLNEGRGGMSCALGDLDGDGDLDLYIANYRTVTLRDQPNTHFTVNVTNGQPFVSHVNGRPITDPGLANRFRFDFHRGPGGQVFMNQEENGEPDVLCLNDGHGHFTPAPFTGGRFRNEDGQPLAKPLFDWGLSVLVRDLNGDGAPDIYVCNDFKSPDRIWLNDGRGNFRAIAPLALRHICLSAMGADVADLDRDGHDDIFVLDMLSRVHERRLVQRTDLRPEISVKGAIDNRPQYPRNNLFRNRGDGTYEELAQYAGLQASEWSWTPIFVDVDLDGYEDLLVCNGFERDGMNVDTLAQLEAMKARRQLSPMEQLGLRKLFPRLSLPNLAFHNHGDWTFAETGAAWGFHDNTISHGMVLADLDGDGDQDVVMNNFNGAPGIYRNETVAARVAVRLRGKAPNTHGIGARVFARGGPVPQSQEIMAGGRYLSSDEPMRVFAAGTARELEIEVRWRDGGRSVVEHAQPNRLYEIAQAGPSVARPAAPHTNSPPQEPFFEDVSAALNHLHVEDAFDDFARQPLLPRRMSQMGPGVSWFDLDGDGYEDVLIASGRGGRLAAFRNDGKGGFVPWAGPPFNQAVTRDQTTVLGWRDPQGHPFVLAGSGNYEDGLPKGSVVRMYNVGQPAVLDTLPGAPSSTGPLAMADYDGDGSLDLFVGGRVVPGEYPRPASSLLFRFQNGQFLLDQENTARLGDMGLASGAVWSDLDGDGDPDLVLACEWGPVRVLRNEGGKLSDATEALGFSIYRGWWNGVATGDFDGDGRLDIVASNWGRNTQYQAFRYLPLRLYYGDLSGQGTLDLVEAYYEPSMKSWVPMRPLHEAAAGMPWLRARFQTHEAYAKANLDEIFGPALERAQLLQATWLESTLFLNRGDHFEAEALPWQAQLAPAFAVCVGDLDGDGNEDVFLSQNFFATRPEVSRYDAGRGLWLRGDGQGGFEQMTGQASGLLVYGEQRGAALSDYDHDGRTDLVVSQNAAATKLFHNRRGRPGLRVALQGPPGNPAGVGAVIRLADGDRMGPAREVQSGSGYWSQNSAVQVLGSPGSFKEVRVRWPGGHETRSPFPPGAHEVVIDAAGHAKVKP